MFFKNRLERIDDICNNKPSYYVFWYLNMSGGMMKVGLVDI